MLRLSTGDTCRNRQPVTMPLISGYPRDNAGRRSITAPEFVARVERAGRAMP